MSRSVSQAITFLQEFCLPMKHLITMTLTAILAVGIAGCNKTEKVSATATCASQCDAQSNCDSSKAKPAAAGAMSSCCPSKAKTKPAAAGAASDCCAAKAKVSPAAAQDCDPANCDPATCKGKGQAGCNKASKAAGCNKSKAAGCPLSGSK